jgi:hypothetical protein
MHKSSEFSDNDLKIIKEKVGRKYDAAFRRLLLLFIPLCLATPYIPKRKASKYFAQLDYTDEVLTYGVIYAFIIITFAVWHPIKTKKEISDKRRFLKKNTVNTAIKNISRAMFQSHEYVVTTDLAGDLNTLKLNETQLNNISNGDFVEIEYEEQTKSILTIKILLP